MFCSVSPGEAHVQMAHWKVSSPLMHKSPVSHATQRPCYFSLFHGLQTLIYMTHHVFDPSITPAH